MILNRRTGFLAAGAAMLLLSGSGSSHENVEGVEAFLPSSPSVTAQYVVIERDPAFDDFSRRMQEAREKNSQWYAEYSREHQSPDFSPPPWHPNFGVSREEYEHFVEPMNQFHEVARQKITLHVQRSERHALVELEGESLLLPRIDLDLEARTARTPLDVLPYRAFIELEEASLPPGVHRGVHFRTPDVKIRESRRRESLLIGEVAEMGIGILHYELKTPETQSRIYVTWTR
jgi:hypothetical protein